MTKEQFSEALKIARSPRSLEAVDDTHLYGCGLPDFRPVYTTLDAVAKMIRWQCCGLFSNDTIVDAQELDNMARIARRMFLVV